MDTSITKLSFPDSESLLNRSKNLASCLQTVLDTSKTGRNLDQTAKHFKNMLKEVFDDHFSNNLYVNNIYLKVATKHGLSNVGLTEEDQSKIDTINYSILENMFRISLNLIQNKNCKFDLLFFKDIIISILTHLRLNDGKPYRYLINELFSLLIDLNQVQNNYLKNDQNSIYLFNDIEQFKKYREEIQKLNLTDYLIQDNEVPLNNLKQIRAYYIHILQILTECIEPIQDLTSVFKEKVCNLIELNLVSSTKEMDNALVNFVTNCFFVYDSKSICFQKYFYFVCSITERFSNDPIRNDQQLAKLWFAFFDCLDLMHSDDKKIQLMYYLVDNSINLHKCKNNYFLQFILPTVLFKVFDKEIKNLLEGERDKSIYQRLIVRVLDFYINNLAESSLQSTEWCKLVKCLLIQDYHISLDFKKQPDYVNSPDTNVLINYSYLFKFWEFLNQNADSFLFDSPNLLIKSINFANAFQPCIHYIYQKEIELPEFFKIELIDQLINTFLDEFKKPIPTIEESKDELIEHIYLAINNFTKLSNELKRDLTTEQIAVFYLPWHERKLKFVNKEQNIMNNLSRRNFRRSSKILEICINTIGKLSSYTQHENQLDFFDHILNFEYDELKEIVESQFMAYMFIANRFSENQFKNWLFYLIERNNEAFISSILGQISCLLYKNCEALYEIVDPSGIEIESKLNCTICDNICELHEFDNLNMQLINLVRMKFNDYLNLKNLDNLNNLINKSSKQFFNHIDIDEELMQNVLNLFDVVEPETKKSFDLFLNNMFNSLKVGKENFYEYFEERFFKIQITDCNLQVRIAKFENIALMCKYFPKYQLQIVIYLLKNGVLCEPYFAHHISIILREVVFGHDKNCLLNYFIENKSKICEEMFSLILEQDVTAEEAHKWILRLVYLFAEYQNRLNLVFVETFRILLPFFIKHRNLRSEALLNHVLNNLNFTTFEQLILQYFDPLILYFVRNMTIEEIKSSFEYINSFTQVNIRKLFSKKAIILYQLLYEYSDQPKSINYLLSILNCEEHRENAGQENSEFVDFNENSKALSLYLTEKMGGYLANLNIQFNDTSKNITFKTLLIKSLELIIRIIPTKTISSYFEKLMGILRSAFKYQSADDENYKNYVHYIQMVWGTLINKCEDRDLTKNLSLICKNLLDLLPIDGAGVSNVFKQLICQNETKICKSLKELHFIPSNNRLMNPVYNVIQKYLFSMPKEGDIKAFEKALKILEESLQVENPEIKYFHYRKLLQVVSENEQCLRSYYSSGNDLTAQPIISRLMYKMIEDSKMDDHNLRIIIGECLGEFGALDPGRLSTNQLNNQKNDTKFLYTSIDDEDFAILIINKLFAYFELINELKFQDCINYALQEIIKIYEVKQNPTDKIWNRMQPRCQSICQQLFNSNFTLQEKICLPSHPVYKEAQNFSDWITKWCISLVYKIEGKAHKLFASLCPLINHNMSLAEYILPFIVIVVLIDGSQESTKKVLEEIDYLIANCLPNFFETQDVQIIDQENRDEINTRGMQTTVQYESKSEQYQCAHALFTLIDFLTNWCKMAKSQLVIRNRFKNSRISSRSTFAFSTKCPTQEMYKVVSYFLSKISKFQLSNLAASCQSNDRALMYLEEFIYEHKDQFANNYDNLQKLYVALEEPDGVDGIIMCRKEETSLYNSILSHEVNNELQEAISCCEKANKTYPNELNYSIIYLRCLLLLGHENTAKIFATNSINQQPQCYDDLQPFIIEAAWKMCDWDNLEQELDNLDKSKLTSKFEVGIGSLFIAIRRFEREKFDELIKRLRLNELNQISVSSVGNRAYTCNYPNLVRLHMLNEIEYFFKNNYINCINSNNKERISQLTKRFTVRTKIVQTSVRLKEPLINLQRVLINICSVEGSYDSELAQLWLTSAKLARKSNNFQSAYNFLLEIQILEQQNVSAFSSELRAKIIIEKAKYHWRKDTLEDKEKAIKELYRGIEQLNIQMQESNFKNLKPCLTFAKLHLLYNNYSEKTFNLDADTLKENYTKITTCYNNYEESHFNLGIYFDSLAKSVDAPHEKAEFLYKVIKNLGESLKYGSKHVYESMPKLLTAWCDLGDFRINLDKNKSSTSKFKKQQEDQEKSIFDKYISSSTNEIKHFLKTIRPYNFYTAASQLTSRMCHPSAYISNQISEIISELIKIYPHQTIWLILSSLLSENNVRKELCNKMVRRLSHYTLIQCYINFGSILCDVCNYQTDNDKDNFNLNEKFPALENQLNHARINNFQLLVPFQCFMNVQLPNPNQDECQQSLHLKNNLVFVSKFQENVIMLRSMVKPKKITIQASDGQTYVMMCKPRDDLRKDNRAMEFNNLVNRHLRKNSETRKRNLFIKTYTVVPLRHDCGLIEWINDLQSYRDTLVGTYTNEIADFRSSMEKVKSIYIKKMPIDLEEKVKIFKEKVLPEYPPIYHRWFLNQFQNPTAWYNARLNFVRSCAVMSIVGYIIGLGDRHGENILINSKTGHLVHVDFNCLFNKGTELEVPEVVPFRLTHNMIDAMGPTGYEGVYRKTCESTLRLMREQREALMSVLTTFVHDPLIEWNKQPKNARRTNNTELELNEVTNKTALENLDRIRYRLNGQLGLDVKNDESTSLNKSIINRSMKQNQTTNNLKLPISVNYQVSHLIEEATRIENLCRMYVGWGSFL